jgi:hypothetical protein
MATMPARVAWNCNEIRFMVLAFACTECWNRGSLSCASYCAGIVIRGSFSLAPVSASVKKKMIADIVKQAPGFPTVVAFRGQKRAATVKHATKNVVEFPSESGEDVLTAILRDGAREMLARAIHAEVAEYVEERHQLRDEVPCWLTGRGGCSAGGAGMTLLEGSGVRRWRLMACPPS